MKTKEKENSEKLCWNIANWQLEKSYERKETEKKKLTCFFKNLQLLNFEEKNR